MVKTSKRSIKFLRKNKNEDSSNGLKKNSRKLKINKQDILESEDIEVDKVIGLKRSLLSNLHNQNESQEPSKKKTGVITK